VTSTLIQTAIVHAQFEVIHPFKDGNGRIGRVLIPLFLYQQRTLATPMFYLSEYLEANREEYYEHLKGISRRDDWLGWITFFLVGVEKQAAANSRKVRAMLKLYDQMKSKISEITRSQFSIVVLDEIFKNPIFQSNVFAEQLGLNKRTSATLLKQLRDAGILTTLKEASGRRAAVLAFPSLLNIAEGYEVLPE
jgi:Fic family protein